MFPENCGEICKKLKRVKLVNIDGLVVECVATSQSGLTDWNFKLDFNDYGKLTKKCWISSNFKSSVPERLRDLINENINLFLEAKKNEDIGKNNKFKYISKPCKVTGFYDAIFCTSCGRKHEYDANYCRICGTRRMVING